MIFAPKNILLIRLKSIGDVIFTLPAVNAVRDNFPGAKISFLTSQENAALLAGFRAVDEIIPLDRAAIRNPNPLKSVPGFLGLLRRLRAGKFDLVVDFQGYGETAWLARLSGARSRWGSVYRDGSKWAYTLGVDREAAMHHADRGLKILEAGGLKIKNARNEYVLPENFLAEARAWLAANKIDSAAPLVYIQPFTSSPHKNWPFENYLALAKHWQERGVRIIMGGGPANRPQLERARQAGCLVPEKLSRLADVSLMRLSTVVVGGDTGFLHLAVALGRRVVMLVEPVVSSNALPFRHPDWAVLPPPKHPVAKIEFEKVVAAVGAVLAETKLK
jgi:ADP-heptose:LPS heptosyltransferase